MIVSAEELENVIWEATESSLTPVASVLEAFEEEGWLVVTEDPKQSYQNGLYAGIAWGFVATIAGMGVAFSAFSWLL